MKKLIILPIIILGLFVSCKKSSDTPAPACDMSMAKIAGSYKVTAIKYKFNAGSPEIDAYTTLLDDCQRDNIYVLNASGVLNYNDVGLVCAPPETYVGTWTVSGSTINIDGRDFSIISYNCITLVASASNVNTTGDKATFTFTKQ